MALVQLPNGHYALNNNEVYYFPIVDKDANGNIVPAPVGDVVSASSNGQFAASLAFAVTTIPGSSPAEPAISATPLVIESDASNSGGGIGLTMTDSAGLVEDMATKGYLFDIVVPPPGPPVTEGINLAGVAMVSQPTPTATGP